MWFINYQSNGVLSEVNPTSTSSVTRAAVVDGIVAFLTLSCMLSCMFDNLLALNLI